MKLEFFDPEGAATGTPLCTGKPKETRRFMVSEPLTWRWLTPPTDWSSCAEDVGCTAMEVPQDLDANADLMKLIDAIRRAGGTAMVMAERAEDVKLANPRIAIVAEPDESTTLNGRRYSGDQHDVAIRLVSTGSFHRVSTL